MINSLNLSKKVRLIGTQTNINEIYNALVLHILSSTSEGFPNSLIEALSLVSLVYQLTLVMQNLF